MKKISSAFMVLWMVTVAIAQVQKGQDKYGPSFFSTSPNASSLGTYGLIPLNLSTGSPNLNIDLLKFSTKGNEYNISLSYNLSSVKPETSVQWTGLGWNLNVGGAVTRSMNRFPDEFRGVSLNQSNYYDNYLQFDVDNWHTIPGTVFNDSPDMFMFEINGINGKFYRNHKGKWIVTANQEVSFSVTDELKYDYFTYPNNNKDRCIYGFEIIDKTGNVYTFGKNPNALEIVRSSVSSSNGYAESSYYESGVGYNPNYIGSFVKTWYLTSIKYANGTSINFEYEGDNNITLLRHNSVNLFNGKNNIGSINLFITTFERAELKYLKKITFEEGSVTFNRSLANVQKYAYVPSQNADYNNILHWYKLNSIILQDTNNNIIDKTIFSYEENTNSKLKLNNLSIGKDPSQIKKYSFTYNPNKFPENSYNSVDHWGFFNNKQYGFQTITLGQITQSETINYFNGREPDSNAVYAEVLERVDYPTKGYSILEYEPNYYSKFVKNENGILSIIDNNIDKITGGLRVKKILSYEKEGAIPTFKEYFYVRNLLSNQNISSGVLSGIPNYVENINFDAGNGASTYWNLSSNSYIPLSETSGYHIGYTNVYEKHENGSMTEYIYSNYDNGFNDFVATYPSKRYNTSVVTTVNLGYPPYSQFKTKEYFDNNSAVNSLSNERGLLLNKKDYDTNNNVIREILVKYNSNSNRFTNEIRSFISDYKYARFGPPMGGGLGYDEIYIAQYRPYLVYTNAIQKTEEKTIEYFNNKNIETKITYTFDDSFSSSPKKIIKNLSDGNIFEQNFLYPQHVRVANQPQYYPQPYFSVLFMLSKNMVGVPLAIANYKNGKFINRKQTVFEYNGYNTMILPKAELSYFEDKMLNEPNSNVPSLFPKTDEADTEISYDKYDSKGNLQQYTTKSGISTVIIWGYNQTQPIAKIEGAKLTDISQSLIDSIVTASNTDASASANNDETTFLSALNTFRNSLPNYQITTYTYDPLIGVRSITPPSGIREVYLYDSANRLMEIREKDKTGNLLKEFKYNYKH